MSNFALTTFILLVFLFAAGLALGNLARARYEQQKRISTAPKDENRDSPAG
jgi:preprotein translocase subunit SecG